MSQEEALNRRREKFFRSALIVFIGFVVGSIGMIVSITSALKSGEPWRDKSGAVFSVVQMEQMRTGFWFTALAALVAIVVSWKAWRKRR